MNPHKNKPKVFVQPTHIFREDILVCVGASFEDVKKFVKGEVLKSIERYKGLFQEVLDGKQLGYAVEANGWLYLILPKFKDTWSYWEILIHELHHIVFYMSKKKTFDDEMEAMAYLQEWLFREIRRKLQGIKK